MIVNPGIRRFLGSAIQRLFNSASFYAPLTHTAVPQRAATGTTATFTRATTKTWQNNDGYLVTGLSGEIGFPGARRIRSYISASSEDFSNAAWTKLSTTVVVNQAAAPNGTLTADLVHPASSGADRVVYQNGLVSTVVGDKMILEIYAKYAGIQWLWFGTLGGGTTTAQLPFFDLQNGVVGQAGTYFNSASIEDEGDGWYRCIAIKNAITAAPLFPIYGFGDADGSTTVTANGTDGLYLWGAQLEDVTAQTTQTAGEYVSVGVVQRNRLLNSNGLTTSSWTAIAATITDRAVVGPDGGYAAKIIPSSTGASRGIYQAASQPVLSLSAKAGEFSWITIYNTGGTTGAAWFDLSNGVLGTVIAGYTATITAEGDGFYRCTLVRDTFANFAFHEIAVTDADNTTTATASGTNGLYLRNMQAEAGTAATIYQETGGALIYHGSFVDGVKCFPTDLSGNPLTTMLGYSAEGARTNVLTWSNDLSNAIWNKPGPVSVAQNEIGIDGAISAWTLTDDNAGVDENVNQPSVRTAETWTDSCYFKKTTGAQSSYPVFYVFDGATRVALCTVDTTNGVATVWTAYTGLTVQPSVARCRSYNSTKWFVELSFTATAATWTTTVGAAGTTNATQSSGVLSAATTGSCVVERFQAELGSFATSYIPTTTAAATRNADILTYTGGDVPNLKTLLSSSTVSNIGAGVSRIIAGLSNGTTGVYTIHFIGSGNLDTVEGATGGGQWIMQGTARTADSLTKIASSWATNDVKGSKNGVALTQDTTATMPVVDRLEVGHIAGTLQPNANVGGIYGWTRNLSQSELNAVTA